jgi:hypothetical protein
VIHSRFDVIPEDDDERFAGPTTAATSSPDRRRIRPAAPPVPEAEEPTMTARPTTARRLRRYTAGAALILFPALLVPQAIIDPTGHGSGEDIVTAATEHAGPMIASAILLLLSGILMAPAVAGVLHQARDRGAALANAGAVLAVLGGFGHAGIAFFYILGSATADGDRGEMVAYIDRLNASPVLGFVAFPLILCFALGVLVLPWAAWRAGAVHWWVPGLATVAVLVEEGLPFGSPAVSIGTLTAVTVAFVAMGLRVLRMTDAEWDGVRRPARVEAPVPA